MHELHLLLPAALREEQDGLSLGTIQPGAPAVAMPTLQQSFLQILLMIMIGFMVTMIVAVWVLIANSHSLISTNNHRLDDIAARLRRIEDRLLTLETDMAKECPNGQTPAVETLRSGPQ